MKWISVNEQLPKEWQKVVIKTDCSHCPLLQGMFFKGNFVLPTIIQCDHHYETDERFAFIKEADANTIDYYRERITHWMPLPELPEEKI